ncbi:MAG: hypothetical protein K9N49_02440 [Candidatus Marinimicrobia bacterium]|nr:hypothetical protein [Candidatus Neomarinimicrobiota bacterium]
MPMVLNRTLRLFLESIGRREEYEYYLNRFKTADRDAFAVIVPARNGFEAMAPLIAFDLEFLLRLELHPLVLLAGPAALEMRALLLDGHHPFAELTWAPTEDLTPVHAFLRQCRTDQRVGVLLAPDLEAAETLPYLIPAVTRRVHYLRVRGPLRDPNDDPLPYYNLAEGGFERLAAEDHPWAQAAADLLAARPGIHISIAAPWNLLEELFTVRGSGCVVRAGATIQRLTDRTAWDTPRLMALLEESFGKKLRSPAVLERFSECWIETRYRAAALLEACPWGLYLSKFAVGTEARGEGLAQDLWTALIAEQPRLFWRARASNPINQWYERQADGFQRADPWRIFWRGVNPDDLPALIRYCQEKPDDFSAAP